MGSGTRHKEALVFMLTIMLFSSFEVVGKASDFGHWIEMPGQRNRIQIPSIGAQMVSTLHHTAKRMCIVAGGETFVDRSPLSIHPSQFGCEPSFVLLGMPSTLAGSLMSNRVRG